ncbi:MAG: hypothetical protein KTR15_02565 [Phycisphaeraceae bacterium]|nr:hypothetical protein [Phycisphaeraceae bacterium]
MSQITFTGIPSNLDTLLRRATSRLLRVAMGWSTARALWVLLLVVLSMLLLDAALHFAAWVRISLNLLLLAVVLGGLGYIAWVLYAMRHDPRRAAIIVEQRLGIENSQLINAVQLSAGSGPQQSPALVQAAIHGGDELAGSLELKNIADTAPLKRAMRNLALVIFTILIVFISAPGVFYAGIPRYLSPTAYNPPFTTLRFDVQIKPDRVLYGQRATIHAGIFGGNAPSQASIVFVDDEDQATERVAMSRTPVSSLSPERRATAAESSLFVLTIDKAEQTRRFYIETPGGQSKLYTLEVFPVPQFMESSVRFVYPAYTAWPSDGQRLDANGIRVLEGTDAAITITSNINLSGGALTFTPSGDNEELTEAITYELTARTDEPTIADVTLPIRGDGEFSITLRAYDGTPSNDQLAGAIDAVPDARPRIDITDPPQTVMVPENHVLKVQIAADDDVGISKMQLTRSVNGWGSSTLGLATASPSEDKSRTNGAYTFDLPALGVAPGDVITYFATAYDNRADPNGPNQSADSDLHVIQVISIEEFLEYERTKYRIDDINEEFEDITDQLNDLAEQREQILEEMKPLLEKLKKGEPLTDQEKQQLEALKQKLADFEAQAAELRKQLEERAKMPELYEIEKPYTDMLKKLAEDLAKQEQKAREAKEALEELQKQEQQELKEPGQNASLPQTRKSAAVKLEEFAKEGQQPDGQSPFGQEMQEQVEQTKEQLKQMEMADRLMSHLDELAAIIEAQRSLEQRLSVFESKEELDAAEQLRARELGTEQQELRKLLEQTKEDMKAAAEEAEELLPKMSASAKDIVQKIDDLAVVRDMNDATRLASAGEARTAHTASDSAADKLESLITKCEECKNQGQGQGQGQIDGPLKLTPEQRQKMMQQMAQARGVPGTTPGNNPGSGSGYSQGGSQAPMSVRGPGGRSDDRGKRGRRNGRSDQANAGSADDSARESIDAGVSESREASSGYIVGVPEEFRDEAEAYFRRIADENK